MSNLTSRPSTADVPGRFPVVLQLENLEVPANKPDDAMAEKSASNKKSSRRRATRAVSSKNSSLEEYADDSSADLKPGEFRLEASSAKSVKLAANFTEWEKSPLDMIKSNNGIWFIIVPLPSGNHPYRFIVDGEWRDDPHAVQRTPNPFGTENAVMVVP